MVVRTRVIVMEVMGSCQMFGLMLSPAAPSGRLDAVHEDRRGGRAI